MDEVPLYITLWRLPLECTVPVTDPWRLPPEALFYGRAPTKQFEELLLLADRDAGHRFIGVGTFHDHMKIVYDSLRT